LFYEFSLERHISAALLRSIDRFVDLEGVRRDLAPCSIGRPSIDPELMIRMDSAFGGSTDITPKFVLPSEPAARWTGAHGGRPAPDTRHRWLLNPRQCTALNKTHTGLPTRMD
jgi:hypothetical protein